jgi:hypothetical protein
MDDRLVVLSEPTPEDLLDRATDAPAASRWFNRIRRIIALRVARERVLAPGARQIEERSGGAEHLERTHAAPVDSPPAMRPNAPMGKLTILGFAILMCAGCSGGADDDEPEDFKCSLTERSGVYLVTFTEVSGTCGPLPSGLVRIDSASALGPGCSLDMADTVSPDECTLERSFTCVDDVYTTKTVSTTTQQDETAALVTGIATIAGSDFTGPICFGTYRLRYERQ